MPRHPRKLGAVGHTIGGSLIPLQHNIIIMTKIIRSDKIRFAENEVDEDMIEKHLATFRTYRNRWKDYNLAKKAGLKPKIPEFPYDTIRVYEIEGLYLAIDDNVSAILLAARNAKINLVKVIVQEVVVNRDEFSLDWPPIHANRFFVDFQTAICQLQGSDLQRIKFFQPLLQTMLIKGFTDKSCQDEFMDWARKEFDRYPSVRSATAGVAPRANARLAPARAIIFFESFPMVFQRLQVTDCQRVELFKPLLRMILNEGFVDNSYRTRFMFRAKKEFDRISSGK